MLECGHKMENKQKYKKAKQKVSSIESDLYFNWG